MPKPTQRSGLSLVLAGLLGVVFFLLTDPRSGLPGHVVSLNVIDSIHQASPGTWIGIVGAIVIACIGVWLMTRKAA